MLRGAERGLEVPLGEAFACAERYGRQVRDPPFRLIVGVQQNAVALVDVQGVHPGGRLYLASDVEEYFGIMTALLEREHSGRGQWVQSSLLNAGIALLDFQAARYVMKGEVPGQVV